MATNAHAASHYLPYEVFATIPAQILKAQGSEQNSKMKERLVHDAVLSLLLVTMPCLRLRQVREARLVFPENVFKGPVSSYDLLPVPPWIADELRSNPTAQFWQMRFSRQETAGWGLHVFLPQELIPLIEEYLACHRPLLVGNNDPGTLFLNHRGGPLNLRQLNDLVGNLTTRFTGRRIVPTRIRPAFGFRWLHDHPNDYCTLSSVLGHTDVRITTRMFGSGSYLSVSEAMNKVEEWAQNRKRQTEDEHKN